MTPHLIADIHDLDAGGRWNRALLWFGSDRKHIVWEQMRNPRYLEGWERHSDDILPFLYKSTDEKPQFLHV